jgi:hypothetical protein
MRELQGGIDVIAQGRQALIPQTPGSILGWGINGAWLDLRGSKAK